MCRKLFFLVSFLVVLGLASQSLAGSWTDIVVHWDGGEPDSNDWTDANNWAPYDNIGPDAVPVDGNRVEINTGDYDTGPDECLVASGMTAVCGDSDTDEWGHTAVVAGGHGSLSRLHMTGGSLTVTQGHFLIAFSGGNNNWGYLDMDGGTMTIANGNFHGTFSWSAHSHIEMDGGEIDASGNLVVQTHLISPPTYPDTQCRFNLNGGVVKADGLVINDHPDTKLNIGLAGTLILDGDDTTTVDGYVTNGRLIALDGHPRASIKRDYNVTNTGKTTVWAEQDNLAKPWNPSPYNGEPDVPRLVTLSWSPGDYATFHRVYMGTEEDSLVLLGTNIAADNDYDPGPLEYDTTYYWRIDEGNAFGPDDKGNVWQFTIKDHDVVDDFEDYDNDNDLVQVWVDGYWLEDSGSYVELEQTDVHDGDKAMALLYDNDGTVYNAGDDYTYNTPKFSEAYMDLSLVTEDGNLVRGGAVTLDLWFKGDVGNDVEQLYFVLDDGTNDDQVNYEDSNDIKLPLWSNVALELADFPSVDVTDVEALYIGLGTRGGAATPGGDGVIYIDDIRIYPSRCLNPDELDLTGDLNGDCVVDWKDMAETADQWLDSGMSTTP